MKTRIIILFTLTAFLTVSCSERGTLVVKNKLSNARLESISFGDFAVYGSLLPGETSEELVIKEFKDAFPFRNQLEFYMTAGSNTVYLKTSETFELDYDQDLVIEINDSTLVINPALE
jgi:hypothetical protein